MDAQTKVLELRAIEKELMELEMRQAKLVRLFQQREIAYCGSRVLRTLVQVWGAQPQRPFFIVLKHTMK